MSNNLIIASDSYTATRMAVITNRTQSAMTGGAKAMMISMLKEKMRNGIAHFLFVKKDGSVREAWGTTSKALVEKHVNGNGCSRETFYTCAYFDVEKGDWRSFRWESLVGII